MNELLQIYIYPACAVGFLLAAIVVAHTCYDFNTLKRLVTSDDMTKIMAREAKYLKAVYEFQTSILKNASDSIGYYDIDILAEFVRWKKNNFWNKAKRVSLLDRRMWCGVEFQKSFADYIELDKGGDRCQEEVLRTKIEQISIEFNEFQIAKTS